MDALLAALDADPALAGLVFDGQPVTGSYIDAGVFVGVVLDEATTGDAGTIAQQIHELGGVPPRDEDGMVRCQVAVQRGDTDLSAARTRCFDLLGAAEAVIRTSDLGVDGLLWIGSTTAAPRQGQTEAGARCEVEWRITYRALI